MEEGKKGHWLNNWKSPSHLGRCLHLFTSVFLTLRFRCVSYKQHVARLGFNLSVLHSLFVFILLANMLGLICNMPFVFLLSSFIYIFLLFLLFLSLLD